MTPTSINLIRFEADRLVAKAEQLGVNLRITEPMSMARARHAVNVWPMTDVPEPRADKSSGPSIGLSFAEMELMNRSAAGFTRETNGLPNRLPRPTP